MNMKVFLIFIAFIVGIFAMNIADDDPGEDYLVKWRYFVLHPN